MIKRHFEIDMDDALAGMVLATSVLDAQGNLLVQSGTALTDTILKSLGRRGIEHLTVINDQISEADLIAEREQQQERLAILFRKYVDDDINNPLLNTITQYRLGDAT